MRVLSFIFQIALRQLCPLITLLLSVIFHSLSLTVSCRYRDSPHTLLMDNMERVLVFIYTVFLLVAQLIFSFRSLSSGLNTDIESLKYNSKTSTLLLSSSRIQSFTLSSLNFL